MLHHNSAQTNCCNGSTLAMSVGPESRPSQLISSGEFLAAVQWRLWAHPYRTAASKIRCAEADSVKFAEGGKRTPTELN